MSATVFGNQSAEEHYRQIEEDFDQGSVPTLEQLTEVPWRTGRCVSKENVSKLVGAALSIFKEEHGPYYYSNNYYAYFYRTSEPALPDAVDVLSSYHLQTGLTSEYLLNSVITETSIILESANAKLYLRFFNDTLLASADGEEDSERTAMCYFFREVTE